MAFRQTRHALAPCVLEVERKFRSLAVHQLTREGGIPHFKSLGKCPHKTIHDTYYDRDDALSSAGAWVRNRNGIWQAKIRKGGDYTNSRFEELVGAGDVGDCVKRLLGIRDLGTEFFGLTPTASFTTVRQSWIADGEFHIIVDTMDFGHEVGEIELERTVAGVGGEVPSEVWKQKALQEMDERISAFMMRYSWAFTSGKPTGKLTAYFEKFGKNGSLMR